MEEKFKLTYNIHGFTLELKVREGDSKVIFKDKCNVNNQKEMRRIFEVLKLKYDIDVASALRKGEEDWFE